MEYKVTMPILSDTMDKGKLIKWYVKAGDYVKKGDKLCEVESDKATMDIESFVDGVVKEILVKEGEEVPVKSVIAIIETTKQAQTQIQPQPQKTPKETKKEEIDIDIDEIINEVLQKPIGSASPAAM